MRKKIENYNYSLAGKMWHLYVSNTGRYMICEHGQVWMPKDVSGTPLYLSMRQIQGHLGGFYNVAVFASRKSSRFICFDVDHPEPEVTLAVIDTLVGLGFRRRDIYPSVSGGKGYHVEIFIDKPEAVGTLYKLYRAVIERGGFDRRKVEFRPTDTQSIRLPLSAHYKTGKMGWYCDNTTLAPIESTDYIFQIKPMAREDFEEIVRGIKLRPNSIRRAAYETHGSCGLFNYDKNPAPVITEPHTRHDLMVKYARWLRGCGCTGAEIYQKLVEWTAAQDRALMESTDEEIARDIELVAEWAGGLQIEKESGNRLGERGGNAKFGWDDLNYILNGKTKSDHKILFRSVLAQKVFGRDQAAQRLIASSLGMAAVTATVRTEALVDAGVLKRFAGVHGIKSGGRYFTTANSYTPGDNVAEVLEREDCVGEWELREQLRWGNVLWYYADMMTTMLGPNTRKYLGTNEINEIGRILKEGRKVAADSAEGNNDDAGGAA